MNQKLAEFYVRNTKFTKEKISKPHIRKCLTLKMFVAHTNTILHFHMFVKILPSLDF